MEWTQFTIFIITIAGMFIWNRAESRADIRHFDQKMESNRELVRTIHDESKAMISAIQNEIKDFHYRLLDIEKNKKT